MNRAISVVQEVVRWLGAGPRRLAARQIKAESPLAIAPDVAMIEQRRTQCALLTRFV